jgi:hypothetical protein
VALHLLIYVLVLRDALRATALVAVPFRRSVRLATLGGGAIVLYSYCMYSTVNMVACGAALMMSWYLGAAWLSSCDILDRVSPARAPTEYFRASLLFTGGRQNHDGD